MAKLTVTKVAKHCLKIAEHLNPQLEDPRLQDLRVSIKQARRALESGQLPRWQVKRLVDTVALAAMLTGRANYAEQVFGLWMKAGQSISQNPASLVLEALPDLGKNSENKSQAETQAAPPPAVSHSPETVLPAAPASSHPQVPVAPAPAGHPPLSRQAASAASNPQDNVNVPQDALPQVNQVQPAPEISAESGVENSDNNQDLGMGLAAMISAAYASENGTPENHPETVEVVEAQSINLAPQPGEADPLSDQSVTGEVAAASDPAVSGSADWSAPAGQMPWLPVQCPASAPVESGESAPAPAADIATASSSQVKVETRPDNILVSNSEFPPRRSLIRRDATPQHPSPDNRQMRPAPAPPSGQPTPGGAPPEPAALPQPTAVMPGNSPTSPVPNPTIPLETSAALPMSSPAPLAGELTSQPETHYPPADAMMAPLTAAQPPATPPAAAPPASPMPATAVTPEVMPAATPKAPAAGSHTAEGSPLDDAAIWDYFQKMGFDSQPNMSFAEFAARKNHVEDSSGSTGAVSSPTPASQPRASRPAFAEVADEMPASALVSSTIAPEVSLSPADSALRRAAQSPLAPSRVPPAAPHKPRDILADADRQPSTRLITIRVRGFFDYQPRFTHPKQRLDEPAVAGSTSSFAKSIIGAEGPMPLEFLARRLCQKYRIEYHDQRPEEASQCLAPSLRLVPEPGMRTVWPAQVDPLSWNTALQSPIGLPRKLGSLTLTEVANALRWQISRTNSMDRTEIIAEAFKLLYGISPLTPQAEALADRAISYGIANNLLAAGNGTLWLP